MTLRKVQTILSENAGRFSRVVSTKDYFPNGQCSQYNDHPNASPFLSFMGSI